MASQNVSFFTASDILLLTNIGGKEYDSSDISDQKLGDEIKEKAWNKTDLWHNLILEQLHGFEGHTYRRWLNRGQHFVDYTWTRIYKRGDKDKDVFFTIGIDGQSRALIYKLDYKHEGSTKLSSYQKEVCEAMIKGTYAEWNEISIKDLPNYNWEKLVNKTVDFIKKYEGQYDDVINEVWLTNPKRLARIAFNEEGWQKPSGCYGKSKDKNSHEGKYGYGNEEWLFDTEKVYDGYHYAFLEPINKYYDLYCNKTFEVILYTVDANTGKRYWIGEIKNLEVVQSKEADKIFDIYEKNNWLAEMQEQIKIKKGVYTNFPGKDSIQIFNIKFKPTNAFLYDKPVEVSSDNPLFKINRYVLLNYESRYNTVDTTSDNFDFDKYKCRLPNEDDIPHKKQYERTPKIVELSFLHRRISDHLHLLFSQMYGRYNVKTNVPAGYGANKVDMIVKTQKGLTYYEIKTYESLRLSIREALGQIFEYAMWPDKNHATKFVILTQPLADTDSAKIYFQNLRKRLNLEIYYQSYDMVNGILSEEM